VTRVIVTEPLHFRTHPPKLRVFLSDGRNLLFAWEDGNCCVWVESQSVHLDVEIHIYGSGLLEMETEELVDEARRLWEQWKADGEPYDSESYREEA
jgi:hypothetical protein